MLCYAVLRAKQLRASQPKVARAVGKKHAIASCDACEASRISWYGSPRKNLAHLIYKNLRANLEDLRDACEGSRVLLRDPSHGLIA